MAETNDAIEEDVGGVQGSESEAPAEQPAQGAPAGDGADVEAPGGGEIEWAGGLIKKAPEPEAR